MGTKSHLNLPQSRVTPTDPSSIKDHHLTSHCDPSFDVRSCNQVVVIFPHFWNKFAKLSLTNSAKDAPFNFWYWWARMTPWSYEIATKNLACRPTGPPTIVEFQRDQRLFTLSFQIAAKERYVGVFYKDLSNGSYIFFSDKVVTPSFFLSWKLLSSLFIRKSFCPFPFSLCKNPYPPPFRMPCGQINFGPSLNKTQKHLNDTYYLYRKSR